jgi:hypothetical protein
MAGDLYESRPAQQTAKQFGRKEFQRLVLTVTSFFRMPGDDAGSVLDLAHPAPNNREIPDSSQLQWPVSRPLQINRVTQEGGVIS